MNKRIVFKIIGVLALIAVWQIVATVIGMEMLLASPFQVIKRMITLFFEPDFTTVLVGSSLRIFSGFLLAFLLGTLLGGLAGEFNVIEDLLWPLIVTIKSVPVASFIVLLIIWFNGGITPIVTFLIAFPVIYGNVLQGVKTVDDKMIEVSRIYKLTFIKRILLINLPNLSDYLISASRTAIGMAWKAGVAAELIGMATHSIGEKLYDAKIYLNNEDLLAWTLVIIIASIVFERFFLLLLKILFGGIFRI